MKTKLSPLWAIHLIEAERELGKPLRRKHRINYSRKYQRSNNNRSSRPPKLNQLRRRRAAGFHK